MKTTYSQKKSEISRQWYILDATEAPLGRVATVAASLLIGKGKATFTPHMDGGDFVVIINAANTVVTGGKEDKKVYYRHSGYPGGLYRKTFRQIMESNPSDALYHAVRGMLPVNKLRKDRLARLKIYNDDNHNHAAQKPQKYDLKGAS